jgi:Family of unknown function (DUF5996)
MTGWPEFPTDGWLATAPTLHRWTQIVGKIRLALSPPINHYWHSTLYVSARGLTTSAIPYHNEAFELEFDFVDHQLLIRTSWSPLHSLPLPNHSVASFYAELMALLRQLGIDVHIWTMPVEMPDRVPFDKDFERSTYDPEAAQAYWRILLQVHRVFTRFRGRFLGKCSPVHFFWGGFDLAVTRFSGRRAPPFTGGAPFVNPHVMHASYSHEVCSAGFWPGDANTPPAFYVYAVPQPGGFSSAEVRPAVAKYDSTLGEYLLAYREVQSADQPDSFLLDFLQTTYDAAANLGNWDRALLEQDPPCACTPAQIAALPGAPHVH